MMMRNPLIIHLGDVNSHHYSLGYSDNSIVGEQLSGWASANDRFLLYDAKQLGSFPSTQADEIRIITQISALYQLRSHCSP